MHQVDISKIKGKSVLITGGLGFLGINLSRKLLGLGANVTLFVSPGKNREKVRDIESKLKIFEGNLSSEKDIETAVKNQDFLFHFAWQTDLKKSMLNPGEDVKSDILGLLNILEVSKKINPEIKIIFTSTVTIISEPKKLPVNEDEEDKPLSAYDINKLIAEKYLNMYFSVYGIKSCSLRLSNIFGEHQRIDNPNRGVLNFMIGKSLKGEPLTVYGKGDFIRDYCYVQNYVDAFVLAAVSEKTLGETFVLGSGQGRTFNEVVEKIKEIVEKKTGRKVEITHIPFPDSGKGEEKINKRNFYADIKKFSLATGWIPKISFQEGLEKTIDFYLNKVVK